MSRSRRLLALTAALVVVTGCTLQEPEFTANDQVPAEDRTEAVAAGDGGAQEPGDNTFVAVDIDFASAPETLPAGENTIVLVNEGASVHNVVFDELGEVIVEAQGGQTAEGTVTLEPGEYRYHCDIPGHEALMNGTLTVEEA